jgi:hypothetical protein
MFNKYDFIEDLKDQIKNEAENFNDFEDLIHEYLDNEVIYYTDCWNICKDLNYTEFNSDHFGKAENICQLAYFALYDLVCENYKELSDLFDQVHDSIEE